MLKRVSFIIFFVSLQSFACELRKPVISLSGPMTMVLEELGLLKDKQLLGISNYHPVESFKGTVFSGGIFLSKSVLEKNKETHIYYDRSREFLRLLKHAKHKSYEEIETRGLSPFEVTRDLLIKLDRTTQRCEGKIAMLEEKLEALEKELASKTYPSMIFFLGKIKSHYPELVMANDGHVTFLRELPKYKSYPSDLAYVPWSKKILQNYKSSYKIGLEEGKAMELKSLGDNKFNIKYRGVLTPGIRQIYFLKDLLELKFK